MQVSFVLLFSVGVNYLVVDVVLSMNVYVFRHLTNRVFFLAVVIPLSAKQGQQQLYS